MVRVHDASGEWKTVENLYRELKKVIDELEGEWNVVVVAVTSDAGGEALKVRKMVVIARPDFVGPDCFGHQVNQINYSAFITHIFLVYRPTLLWGTFSKVRPSSCDSPIKQQSSSAGFEAKLMSLPYSNKFS